MLFISILRTRFTENMDRFYFLGLRVMLCGRSNEGMAPTLVARPGGTIGAW